MSGVIPSMEERFARVARIEAGARQLQKELGYWTPSLVAALLSEDFDTVGRFAVAALAQMGGEEVSPPGPQPDGCFMVRLA